MENNRLSIKGIASNVVIIFAVVLGGCDSTGVSQGLSDLGFPVPTQTEKTGTGTKIVAGASGCVVGGATGFFATQYLGRKMQEKGYNYTDDELQSATMVVAGLGCIVGGKVALDIIENMDKKSKQAQEEAWARAQQQSQAQSTQTPQAWKTDTHEGIVEIVQPVKNDDGRECATRKNYIKTAEGEAEQFIPVCKNSSGIYEAA